MGTERVLTERELREWQADAANHPDTGDVKNLRISLLVDEVRRLQQEAERDLQARADLLRAVRHAHKHGYADALRQALAAVAICRQRKLSILSLDAELSVLLAAAEAQ